MRFYKFLALAIILALSFKESVFAEIITLKSGKTIEGKILEKTDQYIKIELDGRPLYYELKFIKSIEESRPQVNPAQEESFSETAAIDAELYLKMGFKYGAQGNFKEAEEAFNKGLAISPNHFNLKEALIMIDDLKNGRANPDYTLYLFKGSNYLIDAQYKEAIPEFNEALKLKPDDPNIYYYLGFCSYSLKQYEQAINYLQKSLELGIKPDDEIYYYLGLVHYIQGKYSEAINYMQKTLEKNPNDAQVYSIIGTSNYFLGYTQQAKDNLYKAKELFAKKGDSLQVKDLEDFISRIE